MHRNVETRRLIVINKKKKKNRSLLSPLVIGLAIWIGFPTVAAYQDMASLISGVDAPDSRWGTYVEKAMAGSVQAAEMPFVNAQVPAESISGAGLRAPGIGAVSFRAKGVAVGATPDEERINRAEKAGRVLDVRPAGPPTGFTASSVFERTSSLLRPSLDTGLKLAFARPRMDRQEEIAIAANFHPVLPKKADPGVPSFLASLVNNDKPDVLATAYAPAEPDYGRTSPFEALIQDADPNNGRFVPPVAQGDHDWMATPLPASVFSPAEQKCLATAIYFEARGENVRGQAAVGQVVLNRVRNPAYPSTICGVVYQNDDWRNRCQFSFACDGIQDRVLSPRNYKVAQDIAMAVTAGKIFIPEVGSATHYHATYVHPGWARTMEKMKKIGLHIFYRTYGGGWS